MPTNEFGDEIIGAGAPPQQPQRTNSFGDTVLNSLPEARQSATDAVVRGSFGNPEEAAKAITLAPKAGVGPAVVQTDPDFYAQQVRRQEGLDALQGREGLQRWVQTHDSFAQVASDDMPALARTYDAAKHFDKSNSTASLWESITNGASEGWDSVSQFPTEDEKHNWQNWGFYRKQRDEGFMTLPRLFNELLIDKGISPIVRSGTKSLLGAFGALQGMLDWSVDHGLPRDFAGIIHGEYIPPGPMSGFSLAEANPTKAAKFVQAWTADQLSKVPEAVPFKGRVSVKSLTTVETAGDLPKLGEAAQQALREGETPRPGLDPVTDAFHVMQTEHDSAALDELMNRVGETKLRERSPEALQGLLEEVTGGQNLYIPSQTVADLYRGKDVHAQDNILGWMDRGQEKVANSIATGTDLQVPMAEFVSHVDPAVYAEIKDQLRFRGSGVSNEEAKVLSQRKPEDYAEEKPLAQAVAEDAEAREAEAAGAQAPEGAKPQEQAAESGQQPPKVVGATTEEPLKGALKEADKDHMRFYHGGTDPTSGGPRYITPHYDYARNYHNTVNEVHYVDIPKEELKNNPELQAGYDEVNNFYRHFEAPESTAKQLKPVPEMGMGGGTIPPSPPSTPLGGAFGREKRFLYLNPLFKDAKSLGIDETRFKQYSRKVEGQDEASYDKILAKEQAAAKKRLTPEWNQELERIRGEVEVDLRSSPEVIADRYIRTGELPTGEVVGAQKLDSEAVQRILGEELPRYTKKGGLDPSDVAPLLGFRNGTELALTLWENDKLMAEADKGPKTFFKQLVDKETDRRMEIAHGSLSENILDEARELAMAEPYIDILVDDLRDLYKLAGNAPLTKDVLMADAERRFAQQTATDVSFEKYRRDAEKHGVEAERALLKGDFREAVQAKQQHFYSVAFAKMARRFERSMARAEKNFVRVARDESRGSVDQDFWDNARQVLSNLGFMKDPVQDANKTLPELIQETSGAVQVAPWLANPATSRYNMRYNNLTVEEFNALDKSIRSILNAGVDAKYVDSVRGRAELDNVVYDIGKELERFGVKPLREQQSLGQRAGSMLRSINAWNVLVERIFDYTDKFSPDGPLTRYIDRPLRDAFSTELRLQERVVNKLKSLQQYTDSSVWEPIDNRAVRDPITRELLPMTRHNLRVMMLHLGTASSTEKLIGGWKITEKDAWDLVRNNATANDVKWVNGMHELFNFLGDEAAPMIRRVTGVEMERLDPSPMAVKLRDGETHTLTGGYAPINYDKHRGTVDNSHKLAGDLFDKDYFTALPAHSYTVSRTGIKDQFVDPHGILMASKIKQMVHDIAFREAILNAQKMLAHPEFRQAMVRHWGAEYADLLPGWLRDIANIQNTDDEFAQQAANVVAQGRQMVTSTLVNYNPGTVMKHGLTALAMSAAQGSVRSLGTAAREIGFGGLIDSIKDLAKSQKGAVYDEDLAAATRDVMQKEDVRQFIVDNSPTFRNRAHLYTDTIRGAYEQATDQIGALQKLRTKNDQFGRFGVALSDMASAMPMWWSAYKKALARTGEHADAVFEADRVVARAHGSSFYGDKPLSLRKGGNSFEGQALRTFTSLYGFWNHQFNNLLQWTWDIAARGRGAAEPGANLPSIANRLFLYGVVPIAVEEMAAPALTKDEYGGFGRHALMATMVYLGSLYPGIREITNPVFRGAEPSSGMLGALAEMLVRSSHDLFVKPGRNAIAHAGAILGLLGVGSAQVGRTVQGAEKQMTGQETPRNLEEYRALYRKGYIRPRR